MAETLALAPAANDCCMKEGKGLTSVFCGDADLVKGCKSGSLSAFEEVYRLHGSRMKSIALNLLGNVSDAEDAVQESFLKIHRRISEFRGDAAFSTWIFRIVINTCHDLARKRTRTPRLLPPDREVEESGLQTSTDHPLRLTLERALRTLDSRARTVFLLYEVEGFKHREVAVIMNIREGTSKALLFEAKRELQQLILQGKTL